MNKYLFVDTETTGFNPSIHTVHQVAGIISIDGKEVDEFNFEMRPHPDKQIEEKALAVSGLKISDVISRDLTSGQACTEFRLILEQHVDKYNKADKFILVAYNASFDASFLNAWFKSHGNDFFFGLVHGGAYLDPLQLALFLEIKEKKRIFLPNRKLETVASTLGIKLDNAHDALADIRATKQVLSELWKRLFKNE